MPYCAVCNCKNSSTKVNRSKEGISFHAFPKDSDTKAKWIDATGLKNWFPNKNSTICSAHFKEEDYNITNKWRRLFPKAFPTVEVWKTMTNYTSAEIPMSQKILEEPDQTRKRKFKIEIHDILPRELPGPSTSYNINTTPKRRKINPLVDVNSQSDTPRNKKLKSELQRSKTALALKVKQIKRLREQIRRRNKKICSLVAVLSNLKKKSLLNEEEAEILQSMNIVVKELYLTQLKLSR